jgi:hypothetical protein
LFDRFEVGVHAFDGCLCFGEHGVEVCPVCGLVHGVIVRRVVPRGDQLLGVGRIVVLVADLGDRQWGLRSRRAAVL